MNRCFRLAILCAVIPLFVGALIFWLWLVVRWDWLMIAGAYVVYSGLIAALIGMYALYRNSRRAIENQHGSRRCFWLLRVGYTALLILDFAAAGAITVEAIALNTQYTVTIVNLSNHAISDVRVSGGGCEVDFGIIQPGGSEVRSFWIKHDGELKINALCNNDSRSQIIDGYVTNGQGGNLNVSVGPDCSISVSQIGGSETLGDK